MSIESMAIAMHHSKATGATKLALVGIANHDGDGGAWPSVKTLSRYAHTDARSTQRQIDTLIALGEVEMVQNGGGNLQTAAHERPNLYRFLLECPPNCDRSKNHNICGDCGDKRYSSKYYKCPACKPVDNSGMNPLVGQPPRGSSTTHPLVGQPFNPLVGQPPEPSLLKPPFNSDGSLLSTSPDAFEACWTCGQVKPLDNRGFCKPCTVSNLDTPMISCTGCGVARKRRMRGEQHFTCGTCKDSQAFTEAPNHEAGAGHE